MQQKVLISFPDTRLELYFCDKASFARTVTGQEPWETLSFQFFIPHYLQLSWSPWQGAAGRNWDPDLLSCSNDHSSPPAKPLGPWMGWNTQGNRDTQLRALHQLPAGSLGQISVTGTNLYLYRADLGIFGWFSVPFFICVPLKFLLNSEFPWYINAHF